VYEAFCLKVGDEHSGNPEWNPDDRRDLGNRPGRMAHPDDALTLRFWIDPMGLACLRGRD
jgi:hypothetical protein